MSMTDTPSMTLVERLRALADWFATHPQAPQSVSYCDTWAHSYVTNTDAFRHLGPFTKEVSDEYFYAQVEVGDVHLRFMCPRTKVCTAKVVGTKFVEAVVIPATPEQVIPSHEEDIIEWDCHSVLEEVQS